ncbi:MAG: DMT family transporter [Actinomycetota bacterium]
MNIRTISTDLDWLDTNRRACELLVVLATVCWSLSGVTVLYIEDSTEWQIVFYRAAAFIAFVLLVLSKRQFMDGIREAGSTGCIGGIALGVCFITFIYALVNATVANAIFLLSAYPIIATVLAAVVLGERVTSRAVLAIVLAFCGVGIMLLSGWESNRLFGNVMGVCAAAGYAVYSVCLRAGKDRDMTSSLIWAGVFALAVSGFVLLTQETFAISLRDFLLCMVLGFVAIGLGFYLFTLGSRGLETSELTLLALLEIVLGVLWVWMFAGQAPTQGAVWGGLLVTGAVVYRSLAVRPTEMSR